MTGITIDSTAKDPAVDSNYFNHDTAMGTWKKHIIAVYNMPYELKKVRGKNLWTVRNKMTGHYHSLGSTLNNAKAQISLLHAKELQMLPKTIRFQKAD